jgi:hypothetical protein
MGAAGNKQPKKPKKNDVPAYERKGGLSDLTENTFAAPKKPKKK